MNGSPDTGPLAAVVPHLTVKGARAAMAFYERIFGAVTRFAIDVPGSDLVMHAELSIAGQAIYLADENPAFGGRGPDPRRPSPVTIHLNDVDVDAVYAAALEAGAEGTMAPENMFWGDRYARLRDPFGHAWSLARKLRDVPPEDLADLARAAFESE